PRVVEKYSRSHALAKGYEVGNRFVDRIGRFLPPKRIRVPIDERLVPAIEGSRLVAEAEIVLVFRRSHEGTEGRAVPLDGSSRHLFDEWMPLQIRDTQLHRVSAHRDV